ncbi:methylglyoxal reductase (NADPH-dependent) gre2 [Irineochytrium annulatum]|nr:methylglyoxal reductase (NADPH-dependent) gre2 [Irineochytrium annulatum]
MQLFSFIVAIALAATAAAQNATSLGFMSVSGIGPITWSLATTDPALQAQIVTLQYEVYPGGNTNAGVPFGTPIGQFKASQLNVNYVITSDMGPGTYAVRASILNQQFYSPPFTVAASLPGTRTATFTVPVFTQPPPAPALTTAVTTTTTTAAKTTATTAIASTTWSTVAPTSTSGAGRIVTGVTGYLGAQIAKELLVAGYKVKGTLRTVSKGDFLRNTFGPDLAKDLDFVSVPDIAVAGAFDEAVKGVDYVVHSASPFHYKVEDPQKDLVDPAVNGTVGVLKAIQADPTAAKRVKRVVITSSMAAIRDANAPAGGYTEEIWNESAVAELEKKGKDCHPGFAYAASKTLAERAAWTFMSTHKPSFDLVTINPPFIFGPPIQEIPTIQDLNTSVAIISDYIVGTATTISPLNRGYVDVRDVAAAHVKALTNEKVGGMRVIVSAGTASHHEMVRVLREKYPGNWKIKEEPEKAEKGHMEINTRSKELLGVTYRPFKDTIVETAEEIIRRFRTPGDGEKK